MQKSVKKQGLAALAYDEIKELIVSNQLTPGQFITETEMQERLDMGRTPVRDAMRELERDQLLVIHPRRGAEVSSVAPRKIRELFEARMLIEPAILKAEMEKLDMDRLREMQQLFSKHIDKDSPDLDDEIIELADIDNEFHRMITDLCDNSYIDRLIDSLFDFQRMIRIIVSHNVDRFNASNIEHVKLIDAILDGDNEKAEKLLTEHLSNSLEATLQNFLVMQL